MKKLLSILLVAVMLFTMVPASVFAADGTTVKLVSFMRGDVSDLRSSELLEVQVEGYEGNPRELIYKWTSSLGTYLYIYNSHNMYGINNTYGEYEIYNTDKKVNRNSNVEEDRSGNKTLTLEGFMWASVYGAYTYNGGSANALNGTVTVEVFDKNGTKLGSDSFSSFKAHNLDADLDNVVIGLFEGDRVNALDLLGQSGIVHITCEQSKVSSAEIPKDEDNIALERVSVGYNNYNYFIKGLKAGDNSTNGDAQLEIAIKKSSCKFHYSSSGTANPIVYVFKKPKTTTTTTTLTLVDDIDDRCEYFIDGNKGEKQSDGTILFTGLTPNTTYTVEVRAEYDDNDKTKYVYGYVEDTTKPVYKATVNTYLDDTLTDIADIHGEDVTLYLHEDKDGAEYIELENKGTGVYTAEVINGVYFPWHIEAGDHYHKAKEFKLIIENANGHLDLHHYSVTYNANEGAFVDGNGTKKEIYPSTSAVTATESVPTREGYVFVGWDYNGKSYTSGDEVVSRIDAPITLTAKWEKMVNVTINVTIDHNTVDGYDSNSTKADLDVDFLEKTVNSPAFVETGDKLSFRTDKVTDKEGNEKPYTYKLENNISTYTATDFTYTGLLESSTFGVALSKSGYDVGTIEKKQDKLGNWVINIPLTYNPDDFDLDFSIEMASDVPKELYPDAVIVKVACWREDLKEWKIISQQETVGSVVKPGVRVDINPETGKGNGSYPVWRFDGENNPYGYRAVVTGFIYKDSTIIVPTEKDHIKDDNTVIVTYTDGNYTATMSDIADGKKYSTSLNGAYYNSVTNAQQGTLHGVITVEKYNVLFDAQGGTVNGKATDVAKEQYYIPEFDDYKPSMDGHNFLGWYADENCTIPAEEGKLLTEDITLYAKWDKTLTGTLIVDGYYTDEIGAQYKVDDVDRATHALVELEEIFDGHTYDIAGQTVEVKWVEGKHTSEPVAYAFKGLNPDKTYRINVYLMNYEALYQNSTTVINGNGDIHDDYNENDFTAVYPEKSLTTFVNTFLHFEPEEYVQNVIVDSTTIGAGFRPENALVKYYSEEIGVDDEYVLITQHKGENEGVNVTMGADGKTHGTYGDKVWKKNYNGNLYDYQASLSKIDGNAVSQWPVSVVYGEPSRYSPLHNAPTGVLQVKLVPNRYAIFYNEVYESEGVTVVSHGIHIWSYETPIEYVPVREGYVFNGWYSNPECTGEKVTAIAANVAADTQLYAKWEKRTDLELTVNHIDKDTNETLASETKTEQIFGDVITAQSLKKEFTGFTFDSASADSVTIGTGTNEITLYYTRNKYNYTVKYLEINSKKVLAPEKTGIAAYGDSVTENALVIENYTVNGAASYTVEIKGDGVEIIFYYNPDIYPYTVNYLEAGTDKAIADAEKSSANFGSTVTRNAIEIKGYTLADDITKSIVMGKENNVINFYYTVNSYEYKVYYFELGTGTQLAAPKEVSGIPYGTEVTETAVNIDGYAVDGEKSQSITIDTENNYIYFYYAPDTTGGGENGDTPDQIPDIYQKKVIFKVVNGTWSDGTTADKVVVVELMKNGKYDADGSASIDFPTGMKANEGFVTGKWDLTPPTVVKGTDTVVYTYTFKEKTEPAPDTPDVPETPDAPGGDGEGGGNVGGGAHHIVFGKTDGIGWYNVSKDGGKSWDIVFGNSTYEVENGTELIIKAGDILGDAFTYYVNGDAVKPDDEGIIKVTVKGYMLIGAVGIDPDIDFAVPDVEESLNWFERIVKAIKDFFNKLFGWMK